VPLAWLGCVLVAELDHRFILLETQVGLVAEQKRYKRSHRILLQ
jgi:hypothetical protein